MQYIIMHQAYDHFHFILKKHVKLSQTIDFLAHFDRTLDYTSLRPMSYATFFSQIKRIIEVPNRDRFY